MELRRGHRARLADERDGLALSHRRATGHQQFLVMGIGGHHPVRLLDDKQVAIAFQLVARIGDGAVVGGHNLAACRRRYVDSIIARTALLAAIG